MTTVTALSPSRSAASAADDLVGRDRQLELLRKLRRCAPPRSAFLDGAPGVGKSCLARVAVEEAAKDGWATLKIRGGNALFGEFPLAPWLTALHLPYAGGIPELTESIEDQLAEMRSARGLLVLADECHEIDEPSIALLQRLVHSGSIVAVVAARSDLPRPAALVRLSRDLEPVTLKDLSLAETSSLASALLGESLRGSGAHQIWQVTRGNPRYVREVVLSGIETGALRRVDGTWRLHGEWAGAARLWAMVAARLGPLDPDERTAVDLLALAGGLPCETLTAAVPDAVADRLAARAIVSVDAGVVTIAHPLHAEVLRCAMSPIRQRLIQDQLVEVMTRAGADPDRVPLAC